MTMSTMRLEQTLQSVVMILLPLLRFICHDRITVRLLATAASAGR